MKPLLLADDLNDKTPGDRVRSSLTRTWARDLSRRLGTPIQAASVLDSDQSVWEVNMLRKPLAKQIWAAREYALEKNKLKQVATRLNAEPLFLAGSPAEELSKLAASRRFDMIMVGTHGHKGIKRLFLGSVAEEIVRHSEIPVCVIGPGVQQSKAMPPANSKLNLVVATDLGRGSRSALEYAIKLAKKAGASITLVHASYQGQDPMLQLALNTREGQHAVADLFTEMHKNQKSKLAKLQKEVERRGVECRTVLDRKSVFAYTSVTRVAEREGGDIIILGTHGRTLLGQAFFGSTARQTILRAKTPVIVVRSK